MTPSSRTLQHVGEWKIELRANSIEDLFAELARVLAKATGPSVSAAGREQWEHVELRSRDLTSLLVDWANELVGRSEVSGLAYTGVRNLTITPADKRAVRLSADVRGDPVEEWVSPIKAATYHGAQIESRDGTWRAVVLLDV